MEGHDVSLEAHVKGDVKTGVGSGPLPDNDVCNSENVSERIKAVESPPLSITLETPSISMSRESPDGSSDTCDWPTNNTSVFTPDTSSSHPSCTKSTPDPSLVHIRNLGNVTGARPKEIYSRLRHELSDRSDDTSGPDDCISPSLLEVCYSQEGHDGSYHTLVGSQRRHGFKTLQSRHRTSSGKVIHAGTDSEQDSEDPVKEHLHQQPFRRRRKPSRNQQVSPISVKSLVDSRGVLHSAIPARKDRQTDSSKQCKLCDSVEECSHKQYEVNSSTKASQEYPEMESSALPSVGFDRGDNRLPQIAIPVPAVSLSPDTVDGIASSAPSHSIRHYSASGKNKMKKKKTHSRSRSDGAQEVMDKLEFHHSSTDPDIENSVTSSTRSIPVPERKRFMEDGGHSITPAADNGFFPRPQPGQGLIEFLSSKEFHKQNAALDKENAHFNISEALIAALTQMQFNAWHQKFSSSPGAGEDSDEEIRKLQEQIQEKRRQKLSESGVVSSIPLTSTTTLTSPEANTTCMCGSPPKPESTTDCSANETPVSSYYNSESDLVSDTDELEQDDEDLEHLSTLTRKDKKTLFDLTSAEKVAINLLKNFNEQRLPKASELEWLVSEEEVPQKLLPLPTSIAVSPDGCTTNTMPQSLIRGTSDWAPPRPQLILTLLNPTKRSVMMKRQDWRCAGCGMKVSEHLSRHFRLCNYLGRYFCTTCHSNQSAIIPARVIHKWDFRLYPVSNFSLELIESMESDPLFNISALNSGLYKKCRQLQQSHMYRLQLYYALPYINSCTRSNSEKKAMNSRPPHWASDPHAYSLEDLISAKNGTFVGKVEKITKLCINHIAQCQVCAGQGFICEVCGEGDPIFPFQLDSTALCATCNACYHIACFCPLRCPRCIRRETRRLSQGALL